MPNPYRLYTHIGSPYSMKMRAVLRYRRIPHVVISGADEWARAFEQVRVPVMPVLEDPDANHAAPFQYQGKCLAEPRSAYAGLSDGARAEVDPLIQQHRCLEPHKSQP